MDWEKRFLRGLGNGLRDMQKTGQFCDVTVVVDGISFLCHKVVLCAVSPYFTAMFSHDMKENRDSTVVLHDATSAQFEKLLDCIYNGYDILTEDTAQDMLEMASLMQIKPLLDRCEEYFSEQLTVDNFIDVWYTAKKYSCKSLEENVWKFMLENFTQLCQSEDFTVLPLETVVALLEDDDLNVQNEGLVCDAALRWLKADKDKRTDHAQALYHSLRLPLVSSDYLMHKFSNRAFSEDFPNHKVLLESAFLYRMCPAKKQNFTSSKTIHRNTSRMDEVMVVVGGSEPVQSTQLGMRCYSFRQKEWYSLPSIPEDVGPYFAACTWGDDVFISGGQFQRETFFQFQSSNCTWIAQPKMLNGRYQHAMVAVSDSLFVIGGEGIKTKNIEEYQIHSGVWENACDLLDYVHPASAAIVHNKILIFGGIGSDPRNGDNVQCYNTLNQQISKITDIALPGVGTRSVTCDSSVYVISCDGQILEIIDETKLCPNGTIAGFRRQDFGAIQHRGQVYIVGGISPVARYMTPYDEVLVVDPANARTRCTIKIPCGTDKKPWIETSARLACCKIVLNKRHLKTPVGKEFVDRKVFEQ